MEQQSMIVTQSKFKKNCFRSSRRVGPDPLAQNMDSQKLHPGTHGIFRSPNKAVATTCTSLALHFINTPSAASVHNRNRFRIPLQCGTEKANVQVAPAIPEPCV